MKVVRNDIIPFPGYKCVNLFGVLFCRRKAVLADRDFNHEEIHTAQMRELLYLPFYLIYFIEWLTRLLLHPKTAYMGISFEREAYQHANDMDYLTTRKHYAQWRKN